MWNRQVKRHEQPKSLFISRSASFSIWTELHIPFPPDMKEEEGTSSLGLASANLLFLTGALFPSVFGLLTSSWKPSSFSASRNGSQIPVSVSCLS